MERATESRLFIALPLPTEVKETISQWSIYMKEQWPFRKWVHLVDHHITLPFLGACSEQQVKEIEAQLAKLAAGASEFTVFLNGIGTFGMPKKPRILWAGVDGDTAELSVFQKKIAEAMEPIGFAKENRPYRPHVTLAKNYKYEEFPFDELERLHVWEEKDAKWQVREIVLYETHLGNIPMYHTLARFPFKGSD